VTECPYCGHRLRKRAPRLEREGDEIRVHESRREKRRRLRRQRAAERRRSIALESRPLATAGTLAIGAILIVVGRAVPLSLADLGAVVGPVGSELWRYVTAPFVYNDLGSFLVVGMAIWIFGGALERRLGSLATATLILATGTLATLAADAVTAAGLTDFLVVAVVLLLLPLVEVGADPVAGIVGGLVGLAMGGAASHRAESPPGL
jgi:hypothetical protein